MSIESFCKQFDASMKVIRARYKMLFELGNKMTSENFSDKMNNQKFKLLASEYKDISQDTWRLAEAITLLKECGQKVPTSSLFSSNTIVSELMANGKFIDKIEKSISKEKVAAQDYKNRNEVQPSLDIQKRIYQLGLQYKKDPVGYYKAEFDV